MAKPMKEDDPRQVACQVLEKVDQEAGYANLEVNARLDKMNASQEDKNLMTALVYGVLQHQYLLDFYLEPYIKKPKKLQAWVRQVLRLAVYQLVFLDHIPDYAAINEAVQYAKKRGHKGVSGLVNGVLRNFLRHDLRNPKDLADPVDRIRVSYSLPKWLVDKLITQYGQKTAIDMAASYNKPAKLSLRVNLDKVSREEACTQLEASGYQVQKSDLAPCGLIVAGGLPTSHPLYQAGAIRIQDESAMLVGLALDLKSHYKVADLCAGPGGKSGHIASYLEAEAGGQLYASDIYDHKLDLIEDSLESQGYASLAQVKKLDGRIAGQVYPDNYFDRILIDAPCSGMGLLRRKPDMRYSKDVASLTALPELQLAILNAAGPLLKEGGKLVYATCTILQEENQAVIQAFLKENPEFFLEKIPFDQSQYLDNEGQVTILPSDFDSDGFYLARLVKRKEASGSRQRENEKR